MKYILPSLQHITFVKITVSLWTEKDMRDLISNFSDSSHREWMNIKNRVIEKVPQLQLPQSLEDNLVTFVKPIGDEILKWLRNHSSAYLVIDKLCWTPQGTIDKKKTAEILIKNANLDIMKRYELACIYCLENDILKLQKGIRKNRRQSLSNVHSMTFYWTHKKQTGFNNPLHEFKICAVNGNKAATEYFLQKLTPFERELSLVRVAEEVTDAEVLFFLISQMNEEQEKQVFKRFPRKLMLCLLDWPWQKFFVEITDHMWEFISKKNFELFLKIIMDKTGEGNNDCNYEELFKAFWQKSPSSLKTYVFGEFDYGSLFKCLFQSKDKDKINFVFRDATLTEKNNVLLNICQNFIFDEKWELVAFLTQEFLSSETEKIKFKEECEKNIENKFWKGCFAKNKDKWDQLFLRKKKHQEDDESPPFLVYDSDMNCE